MRSERDPCVSRAGLWGAARERGGDCTAHLLWAKSCISRESPFGGVGNASQSLTQQNNPQTFKQKLVVKQINVC